MKLILLTLHVLLNSQLFPSLQLLILIELLYELLSPSSHHLSSKIVLKEALLELSQVFFEAALSTLRHLRLAEYRLHTHNILRPIHT